jgi:Flp pilus assembly protein TadB
MKKILTILSVLTLVFTLQIPVGAKSVQGEVTEAIQVGAAHSDGALSKKQVKKAKRWNKRMERFKKKFEKREQRWERNGKHSGGFSLGIPGVIVMLLGGLFIVLGLVIPAIGILFLILGIIIAFLGLILVVLLGGIRVDAN